MRLRTIAIALVVLLAAAVVTVVAILKSVDLNSYRGLIAERVEAATGRKLVIGGADILLETDKDGRGNWVFAPATAPATAPAEGGPTTLPTVNEVAIEDARVTYRDGVSGATQSVALTSLSATAADATSPIQFALEGLVNDEAVSLSGSIGALQRLLEGAPFPVAVEAKAGGAVVAIKGEGAQPAEGTGLGLAGSGPGQRL